MAGEYELNEDDTVECLAGNIDRDQHKGAVGTVSGFARFSSYHAREVAVKDADGKSLGWFWTRDVKKVQV